jgi:hypothetical protein
MIRAPETLARSTTEFLLSYGRSGLGSVAASETDQLRVSVAIQRDIILRPETGSLPTVYGSSGVTDEQCLANRGNHLRRCEPSADQGLADEPCVAMWANVM